MLLVVALNGHHRVIDQLSDGELLGVDLELGPAGLAMRQAVTTDAPSQAR